MVASNSTRPAGRQADDLAKLAQTVRECQETIDRAHENMRLHGGVAIDSAIAAGDALHAAKKKLAHGKFLPWLKKHCGLSEREAQRYMRLAKNRERIEAEIDANPTRVTHLSLRSALRLISPPKVVEATARAKLDQKPAARAAKAAPVLSSRAWIAASLDERRRFLEAIGRKSLLEAFPPTWRIESGEQAEPALAGPSDRGLH
jgi:hypothetical protein